MRVRQNVRMYTCMYVQSHYYLINRNQGSLVVQSSPTPTPNVPPSSPPSSPGLSSGGGHTKPPGLHLIGEVLVAAYSEER